MDAEDARKVHLCTIKKASGTLTDSDLATVKKHFLKKFPDKTEEVESGEGGEETEDELTLEEKRQYLIDNEIPISPNARESTILKKYDELIEAQSEKGDGSELL